MMGRCPSFQRVHIQTGGMYGPCGDAYKAFVTK